MQRKATLLFLPASRRVRGEFERGAPAHLGGQAGTAWTGFGASAPEGLETGRF